jgi:hypothetical protein
MSLDVNSEQKDFHSLILSEDYYQYLIKYNNYIVDLLSSTSYILTYTVLAESYGVVYVDKNYLDTFIKTFSGYIIYDEPLHLGLLGNQSLDASGITEAQTNPYLNLTGNGVLLGFVDTGIDFTSEAFIYEDGTSKISSIWDQTVSGTPPLNYKFGSEYSNDDINKALQSENPFQTLNHIDNVGHGTFLASVGGSRTRGDYLGACPNAKIIAVKLKNAKGTSPLDMPTNATDYNVFDSSDVALGVDYLYQKAKELQMPISICIGLGSSFGGSDGSSLLSRYISDVSRSIGVSVGVSICVAGGNETGSSNHLGGKLTISDEVKTFQMTVGEREQVVSMEIWSYAIDKFSVSVLSPIGTVIKSYPLKNGVEEKTELVFEKSTIKITTSYPLTHDGSQRIFIVIVNPLAGVWLFDLSCSNLVIGNYDVWLPIKNFLTPSTKLLESTPEKTITTPSTAETVICCAAYDGLKGNIYVNSSRGPTRNRELYPTLVAPGVDVNGYFPNRTGTFTGTSVAAALTAGACGLLLEWGIVEGNNNQLNTVSIKSALINGCEQVPGRVGHSTQWGFGKLNLFNSIKKL